MAYIFQGLTIKREGSPENNGDFIMDELSLVQLRQEYNGSIRLALFDFLELPGALFPNSCSYCGQTVSELKLCGRCRKSRYCCVDCQRTDWKRHKSSCKPSS